MKRLSAPLIALIGLSTSCGTDGFKCGTKSLSGDTVQYCAHPEEICVCATRACAIPLALSDDPGQECESGYVYSRAEFYSVDSNGKKFKDDCVKSEHYSVPDPDPKQFVRGGSSQTCSDVEGGSTETQGDTGTDTTDTSTETG